MFTISRDQICFCSLLRMTYEVKKFVLQRILTILRCSLYWVLITLRIDCIYFDSPPLSFFYYDEYGSFSSFSPDYFRCGGRESEREGEALLSLCGDRRMNRERDKRERKKRERKERRKPNKRGKGKNCLSFSLCEK